MALNIRDVESGVLLAENTVKEWQTQFIADWYEPEIKLALAAWWAQLDPIAKQHLRTTVPQAVAQVEQLTGTR